MPICHADERRRGDDSGSRRNRLPGMTSRPFKESPQVADLSGMGRISALESPEIFGELERRRITLSPVTSRGISNRWLPGRAERPCDMRDGGTTSEWTS